jgi:integrase
LAARFETHSCAESSAEGFLTAMPRTYQPPSYRFHRQSGQAIVTLRDELGNRQDVLLGTHNTKASRAKYAKVLAEWEANGRRITTGPNDISINELVLSFMAYARQHFRRPDGTITNELDEYKRACRPLCHLYGNLPAKDIGPLKLKSVRQLLVDGYDHPKYGQQQALARGVVNQRTSRIVRVWKWAVAEELVPESSWRSLTTVTGLQKGRSKAREAGPVGPVALDVVEKTLPHLNRFLVGLVRLQLLTGARPGELVIMRPYDLDTTGGVWLYRPGSDRGPEGSHKNAYRGKQRIIAIGPQAQEVLRPLLPLSTHDYVFSAARAMAERNDRRRQERQSPMTPSQAMRKPKARPRKKPGLHYMVSSYAHAIAKACDKHALEHWHPHQLRHSAATEIRRRYGLEAAQTHLGHSAIGATLIYAEADLGLSIKIAREVG